VNPIFSTSQENVGPLLQIIQAFIHPEVIKNTLQSVIDLILVLLEASSSWIERLNKKGIGKQLIEFAKTLKSSKSLLQKINQIHGFLNRPK